MSHQEMVVTFDLSENTYSISGRGKVYHIPKTIGLTVVTAQSEIISKGLGSIRFFADGSSTGGRVTLERGKAAWQIDINWLTGQIELEDTSGSK